MKALLNIPFRSAMVMAAFSLTLVGRMTAQTVTTLHTFNASDGALPNSLILSDNTVYGTTSRGKLFKMNTDGTSFTNLTDLGTDPLLVLSDNILYGTTLDGGSLGFGTLFKVSTDGTGLTNLHSFTFSDGAYPLVLISSRDTLYGTTSAEVGTVFSVSTNGTGFTNLHTFAAGSGSFPNVTNSDGVYPTALILSGNTLYGTAYSGGSSGVGTVFRLNANGTGFTNLHTFTAGAGSFPNVTNSDGAYPIGLILSGNTLYGTAYSGGSSGVGTVFAVTTNGTDFTNLHSFTGGSNGVAPSSGLILSGNTLFGTAFAGGSSCGGTVFAINADGSAFTTVYSDGSGQRSILSGEHGGLILSGDSLYGTTAGHSQYAFSNECIDNAGTIFKLSFRPPLTIISRTNLVLSWPANFAGFDYSGYMLQSTTNLASPLWTTNLPAPVIVNGQSTVTNPISGTQQFFRLSQ